MAPRGITMRLWRTTGDGILIVRRCYNLSISLFDETATLLSFEWGSIRHFAVGEEFVSSRKSSSTDTEGSCK